MKRLFPRLLSLVLAAALMAQPAWATETEPTLPQETLPPATESVMETVPDTQPTQTEMTETQPPAEPEITEPQSSTELEVTEPQSSTEPTEALPPVTVTQTTEEAALAEEVQPLAEDTTAVFVVTTADTTSEPMTLWEALQIASGGAVIHMTDNVTLSNWAAIDTAAAFTLDGHGYAISGLTTPLFIALRGNITIQNLTITNSNIQGIYTGHCLGNENDRTAGAIAGFAGGNLKLIGVKVTNSTVDGSHKASFDIIGQRNGYAGGLIGYNSGGSLLIQDCEVSGTAVKSNNGSAGGLIGHTYGATIVNTRISGNTISISNWLNAWKLGGILGCVQGTTAVDVTEVTPSTVQSSSSGNTHLIGRNYGGAITITGGSYFSDPTQYNKSGTEGTTLVAGGSMVQTEDGIWITKAQADLVVMVAQINDTQYATLAEAFAAANSGDTIVLLADVILTETIVVDKIVTLNLNGHNITN